MHEKGRCNLMRRPRRGYVPQFFFGRDAFGRCHGVREIYLDRSVAMIGDGAFAGCSRVETITCLTATPPVCSVGTFAGIRTDIPVTVMMSSLQNYRIAPGWNRFINFTGRY